jgi:hypothetical protein
MPSKPFRVDWKATNLMPTLVKNWKNSLAWSVPDRLSVNTLKLLPKPAYPQALFRVMEATPLFSKQT